MLRLRSWWSRKLRHICLATLVAFSGGLQFSQAAEWASKPPVILALDGIDPAASAFQDLLGVRTENYLAPALATGWGYPPGTRDIRSVPWGGALRNDGALENYRTLVRALLLSLLKNYPDRPIVIIAHSWGSVVAYQVLDALSREVDSTGKRIVPSRAVPAFVTIGSPLGFYRTTTCNNIVAAGLLGLWNKLPGREFVLNANLQKPDVVAHWQNYWISQDCVSGPKLNADSNIRLYTTGSILKLTKHHSSYYASPIFRDTIQLRVKRLLRDSCKNLYTASNSTPTNYGAAYELFSPSKELDLEVNCDDGGDGDGSTVTLQFGTGKNTEVIYRFAQIYEAGIWRKVALSGSKSYSSDYFQGSAYANLAISAAAYAQNRYVVGYTCTLVGSKWKCGCRDSACTVSQWQLQGFVKRYPSGAATGDTRKALDLHKPPVATTILPRLSVPTVPAKDNSSTN